MGSEKEDGMVASGVGSYGGWGRWSVEVIAHSRQGPVPVVLDAKGRSVVCCGAGQGPSDDGNASVLSTPNAPVAANAHTLVDSELWLRRLVRGEHHGRGAYGRKRGRSMTRVHIGPRDRHRSPPHTALRSSFFPATMGH